MHRRSKIINQNIESLEKDLFNPVAGPTGFFHAFFSPSILICPVSICLFPALLMFSVEGGQTNPSLKFCFLKRNPIFLLSDFRSFITVSLPQIASL